MPNYAQATIIGHLGRDPEFRLTQSGKQVANAAVAVTTGYKDNERTTWWQIAVFGALAERMEKFKLTKGTAVGFVGEPCLREYEKKDGSKGYVAELMAREIILLGKATDKPAEAQPKPAQPKAISAEAPFDDEIPF